VHELCHDQPKTTKELLDIATRHASSEEGIGAVFVKSSEKAAPNDDGGGWHQPKKLTSVQRGALEATRGA
jgi:hypothetical protein